MTMALMPPHLATIDGPGREVNRCPNEGCGLFWVPDRSDKRILRCPERCPKQEQHARNLKEEPQYKHAAE